MALGWGYVGEKNLPKNLKEIKLKVTNTTMKNLRMIGTKVNYVKKEVDKCEHCRDTCAGDSGKTIYIPRVRFHKNPPIDIKTMPRQSVSNHEYHDNILTNNGDLLVMVIFNFWYHFSFYNISVELKFLL